MVGRRTSTIVVALGVFVALGGGIRLGAAAEPGQESSPGSSQPRPPLVEPQLLALVEDLGDRRAPPARSRRGRPSDRFERGPRTCLVADRCPSEPCVQFIARDGRRGPACDRFPDPGDARMLPLARP